MVQLSPSDAPLLPSLLLTCSRSLNKPLQKQSSCYCSEIRRSVPSITLARTHTHATSFNTKPKAGTNFKMYHAHDENHVQYNLGIEHLNIYIQTMYIKYMHIYYSVQILAQNCHIEFNLK